MINWIFQVQIWPLHRDPDLKSNFDLDVFRSTATCFYTFWCRKRDGNYFYIPLSLKVIGENHCLPLQRLFGHFVTSSTSPAGMDQFQRHISKRTAEELSTVTFLWTPSQNSFWYNGAFPEKYGISPIFTFDDLWWLRYWPERKKDQHHFDWNCCMLSNDAHNIFPSFFVSEIDVGSEISNQMKWIIIWINV